MYLVAHHVRSPVTQAEGVNAFLYLHGPFTWDGPPPAGIPDINPGSLVDQMISVPPPGNRVRSYLDIVAPDETGWPAVRSAFVEAVRQGGTPHREWQLTVGACLFRVGLDLQASRQWQQELAALFLAAQAIWSAHRRSADA